MVAYRDGSVLAQLGTPDMRVPISHTLGWPSRIDGPAERLDFANLSRRSRSNGPIPAAFRRYVWRERLWFWADLHRSC